MEEVCKKDRPRYVYVLISFLVLACLVYSTDDSLEETLISLCDSLFEIIPSIAFLLVATAAVAYAIGNLMTSEMRARAHVWAMSCLVGAIIGGVMLIVVPTLLGALIKAGGVDTASVCDGNISWTDGACSTRIREILCTP